ncbi:MAG: hypothetical protein ACHQ3P_11440, partial [Candidatus Limnocylindrales bacterium]
MQLIDGTIIVSATDLVGYLACDHLASLELGRLEGRWERPHHREDPELLLLQERGDEHEKRYLERHRAAGRTIHEIANRDPRSPAELRAAAPSRGPRAAPPPGARRRAREALPGAPPGGR